MKNLVIFIEHSDDTKEVIQGRVVEFKTGEQGIKFNVNKFSTFTMLYMEGTADYFAQVHTTYTFTVLKMAYSVRKKL
ncbi:hypothetical protein [Domibacillus mangrovi]|uniref:Uncharacterized protein n=1 Tax=Domibacillus mangrovi TaxID=1714354 RepID=A0A1Q5P638_9BACI|nr:hypothetical protein [Domibacillus mangrovi]OKL37638.1 hypothetical protein BLL40_04885 [Domibacillus mangrovi]